MKQRIGFNPDRRRLLARAAAAGGSALLGAPLLSGCGRGPEPAGEIGASLRAALAWIRNVEYAGFWIAQENGFYAEEGLEPVFLPGGPNAPLPPIAVAARDAQVGVDNELWRFMDALRNGNDFVIIATQFQRSPSSILSLASRPVRTPQDLVGCRFLGQEGTETVLKAILDIAGLPHDYTYLPAGYTVDPLIEGQGDCYSCYAVNQPISLELQYGMEEGRDFIVTPYADLGVGSYANMLFCTRSYLDQHFDTLVGFLRATIKGFELNALDHAYAARLAVEKYGRDLGLDLEQQILQNQRQEVFLHDAITNSRGLFWVDPEVLGDDMYDGLRASGRTGLPPPETVIETAVLEAVYAGRTRLLGQETPAGHAA